MTSQQERFPRLTADMRRFKKLPQIHRDPGEAGGRPPADRAEVSGSRGEEPNQWEEASPEASPGAADGAELDPLAGFGSEAQGLLYPSPLFPLLNNEVASACKQIQASVEQAMGHCRRDNLWRRLFHGEHLALDKLKLTKLSFGELEELLEAVQSRSVGEIDPQLVRANNFPPQFRETGTPHGHRGAPYNPSGPKQLPGVPVPEHRPLLIRQHRAKESLKSIDLFRKERRGT